MSAYPTKTPVPGLLLSGLQVQSYKLSGFLCKFITKNFRILPQGGQGGKEARSSQGGKGGGGGQPIPPTFENARGGKTEISGFSNCSTPEAQTRRSQNFL